MENRPIGPKNNYQYYKYVSMAKEIIVGENNLIFQGISSLLTWVIKMIKNGNFWHKKTFTTATLHH
jgi:hypothetical protein